MSHSLPTTGKDSGQVSRERWATAVLFIGGIVFLVVWVFLICDLISRWQTSDWLNLLVQGIVALCMIGVSVAMILHPLRRVKPINSIIRIAAWPLTLVAILGHYYTFIAVPFLTLGLVFAVPWLIWSALYTIGLIPRVLEAASMYVILCVSPIAFTIRGEHITRFIILKWLRSRGDFSKLFLLMKPNLVRVYTYGAMAVAYIVANIEKLSRETLFHAQWWVTYKDILVEMLLTYVAVDSVLVAWQDYQGSKGPYARD